MIARIKKRDGRIVPFDQGKVEEAIFKAISAVGGDDRSLAQRLSVRVVEKLEEQGGIPTVEGVQDLVETALIEEGEAKIAKAYILYRNERAKLREIKKTIPEHVRELARESKQFFRSPLSEFVYYRSYSRWIEEGRRRETWIETVQRYIDFMKENLGDRLTEEEYSEIRNALLRQEVMPSMRLLWSAGKAARVSNVGAYNCSYIAPSKPEDFAEIMYLSMCGCGVGFSVESQTVQQLPIVRRQSGMKLEMHVISDDKEGWCDALTLGLKTWFSGMDIDFDYSKIRPAGSRLKTMGGMSSGPGPLKALLDFARRKILSKQGKRLTNLDVHDIICKIGEVVVMGGVRRTALISLSDLDDEEMRGAKQGQFYLNEPQRSMANNSAVYMEKPTATQFMEEWLALAKSGTGERGIFNRGGLRAQIPERRWNKMGEHAETVGCNPCLTGDTLVYTADGRGNVPIKELAEQGRDVPLFCMDNKGRLAIRTMRNPRLTGVNSPIFKVTLDDGSSIRATANHKFLLRNGEYRAVEEIIPGDSLRVATRFEAPVAPHKWPAKDYLWINDGNFASNASEHRLIAAFHNGQEIPAGYIVHHKDHNTQNNRPENLEIMTVQDHETLHSRLMIGDNNPMRRARSEWNIEKWTNYKSKHSINNAGNSNKNFSGMSNEELKGHALELTKMLGRRFSNADWIEYAKEYNLPQHFSKWRRDHLGGITGLAKWAALELGIENIDADPRAARSYRKWTSKGYNCEITDGHVEIIKNCEVCGEEFRNVPTAREFGVCSISCGLKRKWTDNEHKTKVINAINSAHASRKATRREHQTKIYSDLKFKLGREPMKDEWIQACKENGISAEISRTSSPFRKFEDLKESATMFNHKVVAVEFDGFDDVYNGTVDEFHNFLVGGFESTTNHGKRKFTYLVNLNCGEIILRSKQFCNLTEVVCRADDTEESLLEKIRLATILGTYQSMLTNFPYLSDEWKKNCEEERLLGVSLTGQWDCPAIRNAMTLLKLNAKAIETNQEYAERFGINVSTAITCVKPSGTVSQLVDAASGMHPRHSKYYIRRIRIAAHDPLFKMLRDQKVPHKPEVGQSEGTATTYVIEFPVKAPEGAILKDDVTALEHLEHWKLVKESFCEHNPSVTISIGEDEWIESANWVYKNWDIIGGLAFLPRDENVYELAPYEEITKEQYEQLVTEMPPIDFANILLYENEDTTQGSKELACQGGICEFIPEGVRRDEEKKEEEEPITIATN